MGSGQELDLPKKTICYRVTRVCNLNCPFCQTPFCSASRTLEKHKKMLETLSQQVDSIKLTGGEPYVYLRFNELVNYCDQLGLEVTVCSNSTLMSKTDFQVLKETDSKLKATLLAHGRKHNFLTRSKTENKIVNNIDRTLKRGINTSITVVLTKHNLDQVEQVYKLAVRKGVAKVTMMPFMPRGHAYNLDWKPKTEEVKQLVEDIRGKFSDSLTVSYLELYDKPYFVVETDGKIYAERETGKKDEVILNLNENV